MSIGCVQGAAYGQGGDTLAAQSVTPARSSLHLPLVYQQELLGELRLAPRHPDEPFSTADRRLLEALARQAWAVVHGVRRTGELQQARERLVLAREEERSDSVRHTRWVLQFAHVEASSCERRSALATPSSSRGGVSPGRLCP